VLQPLGYRYEALAAALNLFNASRRAQPVAVSPSLACSVLELRCSQQELVPSQGHLTHMPAHIFLRCGRCGHAPPPLSDVPTRSHRMLLKRLDAQVRS
jgi:hypothetical protein